MKLSPAAKAGFSLIELIVTLTILVILVGVVSMRSGSPVEESKASKVVSLIETLEGACSQHHADTGSFAREFTSAGVADRQLSGIQKSANWDGPYLLSPMTHEGSNPFGLIHVYNTTTANNFVNGFDLNGDGSNDVSGKGNLVFLSGIDQMTAEAIDRAIDKNVGGTWSESGRVRWNSSVNEAYVLVHH